MTELPILLVDVDGTLTDSYPGIRASFIHALDTHGIAVPGEDFLRQIPGPPMSETIAKLGLDSGLSEQILEAYLEHQDSGGWRSSTPFPGMADLLAGWRSAGIILSTATSKSEHSAERMLRHFDLLKHFHVFAAAQENGTRKSKEAVIRHALDLLAELPEVRHTGRPLEPESMLMIGDRSHDVLGASAVGIPTVLVGWGYGSTEEHNQAAFSVATPEELDSLVRTTLLQK